MFAVLISLKVIRLVEASIVAGLLASNALKLASPVEIVDAVKTMLPHVKGSLSVYESY